MNSRIFQMNSNVDFSTSFCVALLNIYKIKLMIYLVHVEWWLRYYWYSYIKSSLLKCWKFLHKIKHKLPCGIIFVTILPLNLNHNCNSQFYQKTKLQLSPASSPSSCLEHILVPWPIHHNSPLRSMLKWEQSPPLTSTEKHWTWNPTYMPFWGEIRDRNSDMFSI